jgi:hypothetical protein
VNLAVSVNVAVLEHESDFLIRELLPAAGDDIVEALEG